MIESPLESIAAASAAPTNAAPPFVEFPKMARLSREVYITEKIDGTSGCVFITPIGLHHSDDKMIGRWTDSVGLPWAMYAGSRSRWVTQTDDNYGFAWWVTEHFEELRGLGPGRHFGEWWGSGIQRGYGLPKGEKRWSLFNVQRWALADSTPQQIPTADPRVIKMQDVLPACCGLVPVLHRGPFLTDICELQLAYLKVAGSQAAPGFMRPEGIVVYHVAAGVGFKKTIERDDVPKTVAAAT